MAAPVPSADDDARNLQAIMLRAMRRASSIVANPPDRTDKAREFAAARAAAVMRDLRHDLSTMNAQANAIVGRQLPAQFARGVQRADKLARDAGLVRGDTPIGGALTGAETRRAAVLVRTKQADVTKMFNSIGADNGIVGRAVRQARALGLDQRKLNNILAGGAISGTDQQDVQAVRKLMRSIGDGKIVEVVNKHGVVMEFDAKSYADLVYQTAMAEAANTAEVERLYARQSYYVEVIGSNSANFCTAYVGKVFYIGPGDDPSGHFPRISTLPRGGAPFHPRCSKRYVPYNLRTATPAKIAAAKLSPEELKTLTVVSSTDAQKAFTASKKPVPTPTPTAPTLPVTPPPAPTPPPDRGPITPKQEAHDARRQLREISEGTKSTLQRLDATLREITREAMTTLDGTNPAYLQDVLDRHAKVSAEQRAATAARVSAGRAVVSAPNPAHAVLSTTLTGKRRQVVEEGVRELVTMIDQRLLPQVKVRATPPAKGQRRSSYWAGTIKMTASAPVDVVIHEGGHLIEDASPGLHQAAIAFLKRRTAGESLESLKALTKLSYRADEKAWKDEFFDPYVGKDYGGKFSEIVSMGLQYMWRDPVAFAERDPDFFDFLFRAMRGDFT